MPSVVQRTRELIAARPSLFGDSLVSCGYARVGGRLVISDASVCRGVVSKEQALTLELVELDDLRAIGAAANDAGKSGESKAGVDGSSQLYLLDLQLAGYDTRAMPFDVQVSVSGVSSEARVRDYILQANTHQRNAHGAPSLTPRSAQRSSDPEPLSPLEALGFSSTDLHNNTLECVDSLSQPSRAVCLARLFGDDISGARRGELHRFCLVPLAYQFAPLLQRVHALIVDSSNTELPLSSDAIVFRARDLSAAVLYIERNLVAAHPRFSLSQLSSRLSPFGDLSWLEAWSKHVARLSPPPASAEQHSTATPRSAARSPSPQIALSCAVEFFVFYARVELSGGGGGGGGGGDGQAPPLALSEEFDRVREPLKEDDESKSRDDDDESTIADSTLSSSASPPMPRRTAPMAGTATSLGTSNHWPSTATSSSDESSGDSASTVFVAMPPPPSSSAAAACAPFLLNVLTPRVPNYENGSGAGSNVTPPDTTHWDVLLQRNGNLNASSRAGRARSSTCSAIVSKSEGASIAATPPQLRRTLKPSVCLCCGLDAAANSSASAAGGTATGSGGSASGESRLVFDLEMV